MDDKFKKFMEKFGPFMAAALIIIVVSIGIFTLRKPESIAVEPEPELIVPIKYTEPAVLTGCDEIRKLLIKTEERLVKTEERMFELYDEKTELMKKNSELSRNAARLETDIFYLTHPEAVEDSISE